MSEEGKAGAQLALATEASFLLGRVQIEERPGREILTLRVGSELYGVEVASVREILKPRELTEIPRAPTFLVGIVSMRGVIVPVIDMRRRLSLELTPETKETRIVVVNRDGEPFGLWVDEVRAVVRVVNDEIEPVGAVLGVGEGGFLSGVGRVPGAVSTRDRVVILLDLDAVVEFKVG